jgi:hypothetical protein
MWQWLVDWMAGNSAAVLIDAVLTGLLAYPLIDFLTYGWARKAAEIENSLSKSAKKTYLGEAEQEFAKMYRSWYGRPRLIIPISLVLLIALFENFFFASDLQRLVGSETNVQIAPAAIAGAYTFVAFDFFSRNQRRNLSIADIMRGALRLSIAIPLGYVFSAIVTRDLGAFMAFAIGVFPLREIGGLLRQQANKRLGFEIGAAQGESQVGKLSGIDTTIAERIEDADITTIAQLAWCDPIQLTMRTNLNFDFVVDIVSQALACVYLNGKLETLRLIGLRGAVEIRSLLQEDLKSKNQQVLAEANLVLDAAAKAVGVDVPGLKFALGQIGEDPFTIFLYKAGSAEEN